MAVRQYGYYDDFKPTAGSRPMTSSRVPGESVLELQAQKNNKQKQQQALAAAADGQKKVASARQPNLFDFGALRDRVSRMNEVAQENPGHFNLNEAFKQAMLPFLGINNFTRGDLLRPENKDEESPRRPDILMQDYLDQARRMLGGQASSQNAAFDTREQMLRDNAAFGDNALEGIYASLVGQLQGSMPAIDERYDASVQNVGGHRDAAIGALQDSHASAQAQRASLLERLGISDAERSQQNIGDPATQDLLARTGTITERTQTAQNLLENNRSAASDYTAAIANASNTRGTHERAALQHSLMQALSSLNADRQASQSSIDSRAFDMAMQLANEARTERSYGHQTEQDAFRRMLELQQLQGQGAAPAEYDWSGRGDALGAASFTMQRDGVPPAQAQSAMSAIAQSMGEKTFISAKDLMTHLERNYPEAIAGVPVAALHNAAQTAVARS